LSPDFVSSNLSLVQDVIDGVEGSIGVLRDRAGEDILINVSAGTVDLDKDGKLD
jgi:hypothetical protein